MVSLIPWLREMHVLWITSFITGIACFYVDKEPELKLSNYFPRFDRHIATKNVPEELSEKYPEQHFTGILKRLRTISNDLKKLEQKTKSSPADELDMLLNKDNTFPLYNAMISQSMQKTSKAQANSPSAHKVAHKRSDQIIGNPTSSAILNTQNGVCSYVCGTCGKLMRLRWSSLCWAQCERGYGYEFGACVTIIYDHLKNADTVREFSLLQQ